MDNNEYTVVGGDANNTVSGNNNIVTGTDNSAYPVISAYGKITGGQSCTAMGTSAFDMTIVSDEDFFKAQSLEIPGDSFIVKFYPQLYKWQIYNGGNLIITQDVEMNECSMTSKLFYHNYRKIGVFIISSASIVEQENLCILTGVQP